MVDYEAGSNPSPDTCTSTDKDKDYLDTDNIFKNYHSYIDKEVSTIRLLGDDEEHSLSDVFIDVSIADVTSVEFISTFGSPNENAIDGQVSSKLFPFLYSTQIVNHRKLIRKPADLLMPEYSRTLIIGNPGSGKSTVVKYLLMRSLRHNRGNIFPIFISWKNLNKIDFHPSNHTNNQLEDMLFNKSISRLRLNESDRKKLRKYYNDKLNQGNVYFFLDGFDECSSEIVNSVKLELEDFLKSPIICKNRIIISTRPDTWYSAYGRNVLRKVEINPLNEKQISQFVKHYYQGEEALAEKFQSQLMQRQDLQEFSRVPTLLGYLIRQFRYNSNVPQSRLALYYQLTHQLIDKLDIEKNVLNKYNTDSSIRFNFLSYLAFKMFFNDDYKINKKFGVNADEIFLESTKYLNSKNLPISPDILSTDIKKTPLLLESSPNFYTFIHTTIQEYLAAFHIHIHDKRFKQQMFCRVYFDSSIAESEILPMLLGLDESVELYLLLSKLPDSWNFINLRMKAKGLGYGTTVSEEEINRLKGRLLEIISLKKIDEQPYVQAIIKSFLFCKEQLKESISKDILNLLDVSNSPTVKVSLLDSLVNLNLSYNEKIIDSGLVCLYNSDLEVRKTAARALGLRGRYRKEVVDALLLALKEDDVEVRSYAAASLANIGNTYAPVMVELLACMNKGDYDERSRFTIARELGDLNIDDPPVTKVLLETIKLGNYYWVQYYSSQTLSKIAKTNPEVIETQLTLLRNKDSWIRSYASVALAQLGDDNPKVKDALLETLESEVDYVRIAASVALAQLGDDNPKVKDALLEALKDNDSVVRRDAAKVLYNVGNCESGVIGALLEALKDEDTLVRSYAASSLAKTISHKQRVIDELLKALRREPEWPRSTISEALGEIGRGNSSVTKALVDTLKDSEPNARSAAARSLGKVAGNDSRVINALIHTLKNDEYWPVRSYSAESIARIGKNRPEVIETLIIASMDERESIVRAYIASALNLVTDYSVIVDGLLLSLQQDDKDYVIKKSLSLMAYYAQHVDDVIMKLKNLDFKMEIHSTLNDALEKLNFKKIYTGTSKTNSIDVNYPGNVDDNNEIQNPSNKVIFVSYSHKDKKWLERLKVHLAPLIRELKIDVWDDTRIRTGKNWKEEIKIAINRSRIAILLISADFMASDFIDKNELPPILKNAEEKGTIIFPIITGASLFLDDKILSQFQAANEPSKPLNKLTKANQEIVLAKAAKTVSTYFN